MWKKILEAIKKFLSEMLAPKPPPVPEYVVHRDNGCITRTLTTPMTMEFEVYGMRRHDPNIKAHLAWAVETGKDWFGGNPLPNKEVYACSAKDYKLKCNGFGEGWLPNDWAFKWASDVWYKLVLEIDKEMTSWLVFDMNGNLLSSKSVTVTAPPMVDVSYGWPKGRNGAEGVKIRNVKYF